MGAEAAVVWDSDPVRAAFMAGDARAAIALCASRYGASIGRLCMGWLGSQTEAEEAVQETLLAAFDGAATTAARAASRVAVRHRAAGVRPSRGGPRPA